MKKAVILWAALMVAALPLSAKRHVLFSGGKSDYSIVVAEDASASERYAARELQTWIEKASRAKLPITEEGTPGKRILVGYGSGVGELLPDAEEPDINDETVHVRSVGGDILIWGGKVRGTLYAAYDFLERELGCRWFTSTASLAPARRRWSFKSIDWQDSPALDVRYNYNWDAFHPVFAARIRSNGMPRAHGDLTDSLGGGESFWGGHSIGEFIPIKEFYGTHPEYFGLKDGERQTYQRCLSNPDVLEIVTERLRETMRSQPGHLIYSVGQNDGFNPCECEKCQAIKDRFGGEESGILLWFVNQVADAVKDEFPDKYVGTFAYVYTRHAPQGIKPADNVVIRLCSIEGCQLHGPDECPDNQAFLKDLQAWGEIAPHIFVWDYVTSFTQYVAPLPNYWTLAERLQSFRDNNAIGVMPQGDYSSPGGAMDPLRTWMLSKLMWNPDLDTDALIDEFVQGFYGRAGKYIREFLDYEREMLTRDDVHTDCYPWAFSPMYSDEYITHGREIFRKAYKAVRNDEELTARVELAELPLCYLQILRAGKDYDQSAMDLFKRVCKREHITHLCEANGYAAPMDFCNAMETEAVLDLDRDLYGNLTYYHENTPNVKFKRFSEGADRPEGLEDALFTTYWFDGLNGDFNTELCMPARVNGNGQGSYPYEGAIVPGREYEAHSVFGWKRSVYSMSGFDPDSKYVMAITSLDPETIRFKFVKVR